MSKYKVGFIIGSLSSTSINRQLANALVRIAPPELQMQEIAIRNLPLYSQDYDADFPSVARAFKHAILESDAVLFVSPEYNRSIPGGLKNAIDWASRPEGDNAFSGKPSGVIGTSPGSIGTAVGQSHLRGVLHFCKAPVMADVEAYVQFRPGAIGDDGRITNGSTSEFLRNYMKHFQQFVARGVSAMARER